ncbi:hypothetical protein ACLOJK_023172 [Asimina triloba]
MSLLLGVVMRKCLCRVEELEEMLVDFVSILMSAIRFSGVVYNRQRSEAVSGRHSPVSSMLARPDRYVGFSFHAHLYEYYPSTGFDLWDFQSVFI